MNEIPKLPERLLHDDGKFNLYYLNEIYKAVAYKASIQLSKELKEELTLTAGIWGGQYLIANEAGKARTNIVRLYCLVNLPQNSLLDKKENFERLMVFYHQSVTKHSQTMGWTSLIHAGENPSHTPTKNVLQLCSKCGKKIIS